MSSSYKQHISPVITAQIYQKLQRLAQLLSFLPLQEYGAAES